MKKDLLKNFEQKFDSLKEFYKDLTTRQILAKMFPEYEEYQLSIFEDVLYFLKMEFNLKYENTVLTIYCIALKGFLQKRKELYGHEGAGELTIEIIGEFIYDETLNDSKVELFKNQYDRELIHFFDDDLAFLKSHHFALIDNYLNELENFIQTNDSFFLEYFDKIAIGNFFKVKYFAFDELFFEVVDSTLKNNKLLKESLLKPNGATSAPIIAEQIREYKELMLSESEKDFFDMKEKELLEIKNEIFKEIVDLDIYNEQSNNMKELFRFRFKNRNGLVSILYDLFRIIKPNEFKSKKEIELLKEDTSTIVDSKYWTKHKGREVSKKLDIEVILS